MCNAGIDGHQKQKEESRRMIEAALFALMEETAFSKITVTQIAERADVARRTFLQAVPEQGRRDKQIFR